MLIGAGLEAGGKARPAIGSLAAVKALAVRGLSGGCTFYAYVCTMPWRLVSGIRWVGMQARIWKG